MATRFPESGDYDYGLGIEPDIIEYIKESHVVQSRVSPTLCYLLQQISTGSLISANSAQDPIEISSYINTNPYTAIIWASGSNHPDLRPYSNDGQGSIGIYIDGVVSNRVYEPGDIISDNEFAIVERVDLSPARVEVVFNEGFDASSHVIGYKYNIMNIGINSERMKVGESDSQSLYGWIQYLNNDADNYVGMHQIMVRTPLTTSNLMINEEGKVSLEDNQCWMVWTPYVRNFDILIVPEEESPSGKELRYIVENKQDSKIQHVLTSQRFKIKQIEESDERYNIPYIKYFDPNAPEEASGSLPASRYNFTGKIEEDFTYSDFPDIQKFIGNLSKLDALVFRVVVEVITPFNSGSITVGVSSDHSKLIASGEINLQLNTRQVVEPDAKFYYPDDVFIYFSGTPSTGTGTIIVYYA